MRRRWLFGDQLGPAFLDAPEQPVLMIEAHAVLRRRRFHRQKAHLVLSAMRHRAAELGNQVQYLVTDTYREGLRQVDEDLDVIQPTSWAALHLVDRLAGERDLERLPARGYATSRADFNAWADARGGKRLLMEDFYRDTRRRLGVLMDGGEPVGAGGTSTRRTASRHRGRSPSGCLNRPGPSRTTSTPRSGRTWTGSSGRASSSSEPTGRGGSPP